MSINLVIKYEDIFWSIDDMIFDFELDEVVKVSKNKVKKSMILGSVDYYKIGAVSFKKSQLKEWILEYQNSKQYQKGDFRNVKDVFRVCSKCSKKESLLDRKLKSGPYIVCHKCLDSWKYKDKAKYLIQTDEDYYEAYKFLYILKCKGWKMTDIDVFRMIDVYQRYYPQAIIGEGLNEKKATSIVQKIINKHIRKKELYLKPDS
jgi:hypothetical protein